MPSSPEELPEHRATYVPARRGDLDVAIGQAAGELLESPLLPGERRQLVEDRVELVRR